MYGNKRCAPFDISAISLVCFKALALGARNRKLESFIADQIFCSPVGWGGTMLRPETEACKDNTLCPWFFCVAILLPFSRLNWFLFQAITKWRIEIRGSRHLSRLVRFRQQPISRFLIMEQVLSPCDGKQTCGSQKAVPQRRTGSYPVRGTEPISIYC